MKYECIDTHRRAYPLGLMCGVLQVSRSGYYKWKQSRPSKRALEDLQLVEVIRAVHRVSDRSYGSPRIYRELRGLGVRCGRHRIARLMRAAQMRPRRRRRPPAHPVDRTPLPHRLQRRFRVPALNQAWAADLTYIRTHEGWLFLAVVLDLASRRIVGWSMGAAPDASLTEAALVMALRQRRPPAGLLHHSDRGIHYTCARYRHALTMHGIEASFSRLANCWDNAVVESFFKSLKTERVQHRTYRSRHEARQDLFEYIEVWYNRKRRHSSLGYLSPAEFEQRLPSRVH